MLKREQMLNKKGFTMVELLVVLVIVAILAAVATPLFLNNIQRAKASEAAATAALMRQALREFRTKNGNFFDIASVADVGNIQNALPTSVVVATGVPTPATAGLAINAGTTRYFSNSAFTVAAVDQVAAGTSGQFANPDSQGYTIFIDGSLSRACPGIAGQLANCAAKAAEVVNYRMEMDDSGRIYVSYDAGTTWAEYD